MRRSLLLSAAFWLGISAFAAANPPQTWPTVQGTATVPINISTATTTQLVAGVANQGIYVTHWDVMAGGTGNITFEYGTGSSCTGTNALSGAYPLIAQAGASAGGGLGTVLIVPPSTTGNSLCAVTSAGVQMSGSLTYAQY